jgi:hypothetical protein
MLAVKVDDSGLIGLRQMEKGTADAAIDQLLQRLAIAIPIPKPVLADTRTWPILSMEREGQSGDKPPVPDGGVGGGRRLIGGCACLAAACRFGGRCARRVKRLIR